MIIRKEITVNASVEAVWNVLGPRYAEAFLWASSVNESSGEGAAGHGALAGAPCSGRVCETELGPFRETLEVYDPQSKQIAYAATGEKMPFFVKKMVNAWTLHAEGKDQTRVEMKLSVTLMVPFNVMMALPMRMQLGGVLSNATEELKYFIEHDGEPHPRKVEAARKYREEQALAA